MPPHQYLKRPLLGNGIYAVGLFGDTIVATQFGKYVGMGLVGK